MRTIKMNGINAMKTLKLARLAIAGAIVGAAIVNIIGNYFGIDGSHHAVGAVAGGLLTAALLKAAHIA